MRVAAAWFVDPRPRAVVFLSDPEREPIVPQRYLQHLYKLTPAEAAVAGRIVRGEGLQAVAGSLRISLATVCTHRQRVFEKTGTRRQEELIRVILEGAAGVGLEQLTFSETAVRRLEEIPPRAATWQDDTGMRHRRGPQYNSARTYTRGRRRS